jgi:predicted kinase
MKSITLIVGPPASGKSTISRLVAKSFRRCLVIPVDELREMMETGKAVPDKDLSEGPGIEQFRLARATATHMAQIYAKEGIDVIIDDVCFPPEFREHYTSLLQAGKSRAVMLLPTLETVVERMRIREGPWDHVLVNLVPDLYRNMKPLPETGWTVLDSSEWSIEETVTEVKARLGIDESEESPVD